MSKTIGAGLTTHLAQEVTTLAFLWRVKPITLSAIGFTSLDADVGWDDGDGSITYQSVLGFSRSAISSTNEMAVDTLDVRGLFGAAGIEESDFRVGLMDHAAIRVHLVNYEDLSQGSAVLREGTVGNITTAEDFAVELRGMLQLFSTEIVEEISPTCRVHKFADSAEAEPRCYIDGTGGAWSKSLPTTARLASDATGEQVIKPTTPDDRWYHSTNAGLTGPTEPVWNTTVGGTTTEVLTVVAWVTATSYPANEQIFENSLVWVSDGGTSGGPEPTWTSDPGDTIADNDITWTAYANTATIWKTVRARQLAVSVSTVTSEKELILTTTTDAPDAFFQAGHITMTSGNNNGISRGISSWVLSTKTIKLFQPLPFVTAPSDTLTLFAGCDRLVATCIGTYDNVSNFRGEPNLPGEMQIFQFPNQPSG